MALDNNAVMQVGGGHFYTAVEGTDCPTDLSVTPTTPWTEIGHTSLDSILAFSSDGGDTTTLGTLQAPTLRQVIAARTESMSFTLEQWDAASLKLYFGSNMKDVNADGKLLGVPNKPVPTRVAFLVVLSDGNRQFGIWAPSANIFRGDDASLDDTESLAGLPINVTPLTYQTNEFTYALTPIVAA